MGPIPSAWNARPLFSVADEIDEKNVGLIENNLLSLSYGSIIRKDIEGADGLLPASFETYQILEKYDVVWRLTDLQNDKRSLRTGLAGERGIITSAYLGTRPRSIDPIYFAYLLRAYDLTKVFYSMGGGLRQSMKFSDVKWLPILVPPQADQFAITKFLDRETAKIDAAVVAQERLIALLAEKRAATISHAVTKGLDPDAPMKDSGIEWVGQIPAQWGAGKLGYGARLQGGFAFASGDFQSEGIPVVKMNNLSRGSLKLHNAVRVDEAVAVEAFALAAGDIVWGMSGSIGATGSLGNFAVVEEGDLPCQLNQRVGRFYIRSRKVDPNFLKLWIQSDEFYRQVELAVTGTAQYNISSEQVEATAMCFPPLAEQRTIADAVLAKLSSHSKIVERAGEQITLLRERRAALISAAVTGKIDVRGEVEPEEQEAA
ncbi:Type I restriction-modification system, specificity subunit S [Pacificimonas flava]|uniref:Type I restriction-modification system, specificity subunit S n=1 Tax=Pacificimonas flava TaxID=1234595 RepID=M2T5Z3_9SPHN|nr:Type I restriction-modification system, specificity subunit S [Pacificimonas flava]